MVFIQEIARDSLTRIKDGAYIKNVDDKKSKGTNWVSLLIARNTTVYCDCFRIGYILQEFLTLIRLGFLRVVFFW